MWAREMLLPESVMEAAAKRKFKGKKIQRGIWKKREVEFVPGEILIKLRPGKERDSAFLEKLFSGDLAKASLKRKFDRFGVGLIDAGDKVDVLKVCKELKKDPDIEYAEPNMIDRIATTIPNDTHYGNQWALPQIDAPNAWDIETGSSDVLIAILDSGIPMDGTPPSPSHPDLNDTTRIILGHDYVNDDAFPRDDNGHGTHVTGIASAQTNNATGIAGLSWGTKIYVIKVFDAYGNGSHQNFYDGVIEAVDYAVANNLRLVINYSGGGSASTTKQNAVIYARDRDCLIAAAAGNDYEGPVGYPAAYSASYDNVIAVSATDSSDNFADYSNKGSEINVAAPGSHIYSTMPNYHVTLNDPPPLGGNFSQDYDYLDGTSMATPYVSGLAALLLSCNNGLSAADVRDAIESRADDLGSPSWDQYYGYGRIDACETLIECPPAIQPVEPCRYRAMEVPCQFRYEVFCQFRYEVPCQFRYEVPCQFRYEVPCQYRIEVEPCRYRYEVPCRYRIEVEPCRYRYEVLPCPRWGEGPVCLREALEPSRPREPIIGPRRYAIRRRYPGRMRPATRRSMKHIRPLTRRRRPIRPPAKEGPLSHKKRYYPC